jgi:hypothetical protein
MWEGLYAPMKDIIILKSRRKAAPTSIHSHQIVAIKGKNSVCLEIWYELMPVASFPLRPSVKMAWKGLGAPGGRALPEFGYTVS